MARHQTRLHVRAELTIVVQTSTVPRLTADARLSNSVPTTTALRQTQLLVRAELPIATLARVFTAFLHSTTPNLTSSSAFVPKRALLVSTETLTHQVCAQLAQLVSTLMM